MVGLDVMPNPSNPVILFCDNTGAIAQAKEPRSHNKSKHVLRRYHIIREIIKRGDVKIKHIATDDNTVDPLMKPLSQPKHKGHVVSMGINWNLNWN